MRETTTNLTYSQRDFDALAMSIEDGKWNDDDPRTQTLLALARERGLRTAAMEIVADATAPIPVRERALACVAGQLLSHDRYALAG